MAGIVRYSFYSSLIDNFISDVDRNEETYYAAFSKYTSWPVDSAAPQPIINYLSDYNSLSRELLYGKKISKANFRLVVRRLNWVTGLVYSFANPNNPQIESSNFFVLTSARNVYKCIFNNYGTASTVEPSGTLNLNFQTNDGYIWRYLYTVDSLDLSDFSTNLYMPVYKNANVSFSSIGGTLDKVIINANGINYSSISGPIQGVISNNTFRVLDSGSAVATFYNNCAFYITSGPGAGQLSTVNNYFINSTGKFVSTRSNITGANASSSTYTICPSITIVGDGSGATGFCSVANNGGIADVVIISSGNNYTFSSHTIFYPGGSGANTTLLFSPKEGHGKDPVKELYCDAFCVSTKLINSEANTFPVEVPYRNFSILKNVKSYANAVYDFDLSLTNSSGTFTVGSNVTGNYSGSVGKIVFANTSLARVSNTTSSFSLGETIVSGNVASTVSLIRDPEFISSEFFTSYYKNNISIVFGGFSVGELVVGASSGKAHRVCFANTSQIWTTYSDGEFTLGELLMGQTTPTTATLISRILPDTAIYTGDVLYSENFSPITKSPISSELVKIVIRI